MTHLKVTRSRRTAEGCYFSECLILKMKTAILQSVDKSLPVYTMSHPRCLTSSAIGLRELRITFPIQYRQTDPPMELCFRRTAVISTVTAVLDNVTHGLLEQLLDTISCSCQTCTNC